MATQTIQASVGMHHNGATKCYNLPKDVATIVGLLNAIDDSLGGTKSSALALSASAPQLSRAIRHFQEQQNGLGKTPDADPMDTSTRVSTLARLNEAASAAPTPAPAPPLTMSALAQRDKATSALWARAAIQALKQTRDFLASPPPDRFPAFRPSRRLWSA